MKTVFCPVTETEIDGVTCLEIVAVSEKEMSERILPINIQWNSDKCQKCLECKWHSDIE